MRIKHPITSNSENQTFYIKLYAYTNFPSEQDGTFNRLESPLANNGELIQSVRNELLIYSSLFNFNQPIES